MLLDSSVAYTGAALQFIHENLFNTEYDRPDAKNVIVLVTDQPSDDDVEPAAKALRESGVTVSTSKIYEIGNSVNCKAQMIKGRVINGPASSGPNSKL